MYLIRMPKLKFDIGCGDSIQKSILKVLFNSEISYFEEFQYGKDVFQTTTNTDGRELISSVVRQL